MHYYKRNIGDYAKKAGRLSMLQHGAYTLLIDSCYDREDFPTLEQAIEWVWASSDAEIEAVKFVLARFFTLDEDGKYVQGRIQEELEIYRRNAETNRRIAIERETKRKQNSTNRESDSTDRAGTVNEAPPNHKPLTINHKEDTHLHEYGPLADRIWERIQPLTNQKSFNRKAWASDLRKIIELDGYTESTLWDAFAWANEHDFWAANILSPAKLRKQLPTITAQRARAQPKAETYAWK